MQTFCLRGSGKKMGRRGRIKTPIYIMLTQKSISISVKLNNNLLFKIVCVHMCVCVCEREIKR